MLQWSGQHTTSEQEHASHSDGTSRWYRPHWRHSHRALTSSTRGHLKSLKGTGLDAAVCECVCVGAALEVGDVGELLALFAVPVEACKTVQVYVRSVGAKEVRGRRTAVGLG